MTPGYFLVCHVFDKWRKICVRTYSGWMAGYWCRSFSFFKWFITFTFFCQVIISIYHTWGVFDDASYMKDLSRMVFGEHFSNGIFICLRSRTTNTNIFINFYHIYENYLVNLHTLPTYTIKMNIKSTYFLKCILMCYSF